MPATAFAEIRVSSNAMVCSPGLWRMFKAAEGQSLQWKIDFLKALTCDRLTPVQIQAILDGHCHVRDEPDEVLVICVPE